MNHSDSDQGGSTTTLMPSRTTSTPRSHLRPLTIPVGATAATSDTDDELGDYWRDQPSLGRLPPSEARSSQGLNGRRSPIPDGRKSPLLVETLLKNSARSASVSSFFESVDETGEWSQIWSGFYFCQICRVTVWVPIRLEVRLRVSLVLFCCESKVRLVLEFNSIQFKVC